MRRILPLFLPFLLACNFLMPLRPTAAPATRQPTTQTTTSIPPLPAGTPEPSATPSERFITRYHPEVALYAGDLVSLEVLAPTDFDEKNAKVRVSLGETLLDETTFELYGIARRRQATFYWLWDTKGLNPGPYVLTFSVLPAGPEWKETVTLLPVSAMPRPEQDARWESLTTDCCILHYITNTDAQRDIETLADRVEEQAAKARQNMGVGFDDPVQITFMPRVLGHGGFAADEIYVSYLDENYAGGDPVQVIHHEMIHILDARLGGDYRPSILVEGLATYLSEGHFKIEPILPRAAALFELDWYIPLETLANDFYPSQHEIGYLEGAALIGYLVETHGRDGFDRFYRNLPDPKDKTPAQALDAALAREFGKGLKQTEEDFIRFLRQQPVTPEIVADLRLSVAFYDTVRRYQRMMDSSAYFMTAWLMYGPDVRERNLVADYLRYPNEELNQQIITLLVRADRHLRAGEYAETESLLREVNFILDQH